MTSRAYQIRTRVSTSTQPRAASSPAPQRMSSPQAAVAACGTVTGRLTEEEVRQRQMLKYNEDNQEFQKKEKIKADKKRAEKFKRYEHVDVGRKLDDDNNSRDMMYARQLQQTQYANSSANSPHFRQETPASPSNGSEPQNTRSGPNSDQRKEEEFRQKMRENREKMQKLYDQKSKHGI